MNAIRNKGAANVLMIGGLAYSNDLSKWLDYVPRDPLNQIAARAHLYNFNYCNNVNCWETTLLPIAAQYPLVIGEFG